MTFFDRVIPVAFLACVALTACGDRIGQDGYPIDNKPVAPMDTITQTDMAPTLAPRTRTAPAPAAEDSIQKSSLMAPKTPKIIWV
ncbi:hypothetical protein BWI17_03995 [Betaproteobacteria bacterium GR16-43]|nr:hypothetical protein BWI17_03995 [Betaproteobacteria bacterium GR16-43]